MGNGKGTTALKACCTGVLSLGLLAGCSGGTGTVNVQNANTYAALPNASPTLPPGHTPVPEITLTGNLAERTNQKRAVDIQSDGPPPTPGHYDAPEDSTITTSMNKSGQVFEMRVFKTHPQLAKVESTWTGPQERHVRFYLRDGNNRDLTTDKLTTLRSATAAEMLALIGIKAQPTPPAPDGGKTKVKKQK